MNVAENKSSENKFVSGSIWMIGMRWSMRVIGLVSTVILARLLTPEDFGIVAMAIIIVGLVEIIKSTNTDLALIRDANATPAHYDSAWTIQIIQGIFVAILLLIAAPFAGDYFSEQRTVAVIQILALVPFVRGFGNIGIVAFCKELDFAREFKFNIFRKIFGFVILVGLALWLRNYWAMVYSMVLESVFTVMLTYWMHPYRPRPSVSKFRDIWSFSQWMLVSRFGFFFKEKTDEFVIGNLSGTSAMGLYHLSVELATMPSNELVMPIRRALFPNLAKLLNDQQAFAKAQLKIVGVVAMLCIAAGAGMAAVVEDIVTIILGQQWLDTIPLIEWLALLGASFGIYGAMEIILLVAGDAKSAAIVSWLQFLVLAPTLILVGQFWGLEEFAITRTSVAIIFVPVMMYFLSRNGSVSFFKMAGELWRPLVAASVMYFCVVYLHSDRIAIPYITLGLDVVTGILCFATTIAILWQLSGRPDGAEMTLVTFVNEKLLKK